MNSGGDLEKIEIGIFVTKNAFHTLSKPLCGKRRTCDNFCPGAFLNYKEPYDESP